MPQSVLLSRSCQLYLNLQRQTGRLPHTAEHVEACDSLHFPCYLYGRRERKTRVDKDVRRTDRAHPFFAAEGGPATKALQRILLTYAIYNFDLGYCQVRLAYCRLYWYLCARDVLNTPVNLVSLSALA